MLHDMGTIVVLDSGFCVLPVLVDMKNYGVYELALINKRRYWAYYTDDEKSRLPSQKRVLGTWMKIVVSLTMFLFLY